MAAWARIDGDEVRIDDARIVWSAARCAGQEGIAFWLRATGGRTLLHLAGWAPGENAEALDSQEVRLTEPGPDAGLDGRFLEGATVRFGRVRNGSAVVSVDGEIEALDPEDQTRAHLEADLICTVTASPERDHCLGCGGPLDRYAETRDIFLAGFRITQRVLPVLCPTCTGRVAKPRFCPTCGAEFPADAVTTHGEDGRTGYTARCPQGHVFSGALPG